VRVRTRRGQRTSQTAAGHTWRLRRLPARGGRCRRRCVRWKCCACPPRSPSPGTHAHGSTVTWDAFSSLPSLHQGVKLGWGACCGYASVHHLLHHSSVIASHMAWYIALGQYRSYRGPMRIVPGAAVSPTAPPCWSLGRETTPGSAVEVVRRRAARRGGSRLCSVCSRTTPVSPCAPVDATCVGAAWG
jgi:hypothetical protein